MTAFDTSFNYLIAEDESDKYVDDPADAGGPTRWGITIAVYNDFYQREASALEIENMPSSVAKQIYLSKYWIPLRCDLLRDLAFQCAIFDCGVLYGVGTIGIIVQRALLERGASLKLDGILGDKTVEAFNGFLESGDKDVRRRALMHSLQVLLHERIDAIIAINPKDERFRAGWSRRADRLLKLLDDSYLNTFTKEMFR